MERFFETLPNWAGTVPQWGLFFLLLIAVVKTSPHWLETWAKLRLARSNRNADRIRELEKQVLDTREDCDQKIKLCRDDCDRQTQLLRDEIGDLEDTIHGQRRQHVQEQISLVAAIIESVDNPAMKTMLKTLESVQRSLPVQRLEATEEKDD